MVDWALTFQAVVAVGVVVQIAVAAFAFLTGRGKRWLRGYVGTRGLEEQHAETSEKLDRTHVDLSALKAISADHVHCTNGLRQALVDELELDEDTLPDEMDYSGAWEALFGEGTYQPGDFTRGGGEPQSDD